MGAVIISERIIADPTMMMQITLREIESVSKDLGIDPMPIKTEVLNAESIFDIQQILKKYFGEDIIIDA